MKWSNGLLFWESFDINVDSQPELKNKEKLHYFLQLLTDPAYDTLKVLGLEGMKYADAILKEQYGDKCTRKGSSGTASIQWKK